MHKTAISDQAILASDDHTVTFRYRDNRDQQRKTMTLPADEFLRRFLQHVPPTGFHRVRSFGLLHPAHREALRRLQLLLAPRDLPAPEAPASPRRPRLRCPHCKAGSLVLVRRLSPAECLVFVAKLDATTSNGARAPPPALAHATGGMIG